MPAQAILNIKGRQGERGTCCLYSHMPAPIVRRRGFPLFGEGGWRKIGRLIYRNICLHFDNYVFFRIDKYIPKFQQIYFKTFTNTRMTAGGKSKWEIRGSRDRFSSKVCLEIGFLSKLPPHDKSENYEPNSNKGCPNLPEFPWFICWNFPKFGAHGQNHISRRTIQ